MKIPEFPLLTPSLDDILLGYDIATGTTRKITLSELIDIVSANIKISANIADTATITVSSTFSASFAASRAVDGSTLTDWASLGESNPWMQLTFATIKKISKVRLVSRINQPPTTMTGNLTFSDGSSISVTGITNNGAYRTVEFTAKEVSWVRFTVTSGSGTNVGLGEFEVWGY